MNNVLDTIINHQNWTNIIPLWNFVEPWYENQTFWISESSRQRHFYIFWKNWYWRLNPSRRLIDNDLKNNRWFLIVWTDSNLVEYSLSRMTDAQKSNIINIGEDTLSIDEYAEIINTWKYIFLENTLFLDPNIEKLKNIVEKIIESVFLRYLLPSEKRLNYSFYLNDFEAYIEMDKFDKIVSEIRKYKISLVFSSYADHINEKYLPIILGNIWTVIAFHQDMIDQRSMLLKFFERSVDDFSKLDIGRAFVKCNDFHFMNEWQYFNSSIEVNID